MGTLFDVGTWYYVKDLQIFDEEVKGEKTEDADESARELIEVHRTEDGRTAVRSHLVENNQTNEDEENRTWYLQSTTSNLMIIEIWPKLITILQSHKIRKLKMWRSLMNHYHLEEG